MNKSLLIGLVAGAGAATGVGALANYAHERSLAEAAAQVASASDSRGAVVRGTTAAPAASMRLPEGTLASRGDVAGPRARAAAEAGANGSRDPNGDATEGRGDDASDVDGTGRAERAIESQPAMRTARGDETDALPVRARFAEVVDVQPVTKTVQESRDVCTDVPVSEPAPVKDERQVAGTVAGAVIGGLLGNQVGGGKGKKIATIAGAAAGGYAGNRVQDRIQQSNTVTTTERQCQTVTEPREQTIAYDVTYSYEGETRTVRMNHEPGRRLPAREGRVILTADAG